MQRKRTVTIKIQKYKKYKNIQTETKGYKNKQTEIKEYKRIQKGYKFEVY